jgi:hypothetical protein
MSNLRVVDWYLVRDAECLTDVRKRLILLAFVSYETVRLWWWGGNCGVVSFGKIREFCSIPTLASNPYVLPHRGLELAEGQSYTGFFTCLAARSETGLCSANARPLLAKATAALLVHSQP